MIENAEDLAKLITWENGKPFADAQSEVIYAASFIEWFSEEAPRICGDTIPATTPGNRVITLKEPVGVCGLITPWNFPATMITRKIGPALAAGCTVVVKPSEETPFTANALGELARRAGIPNGVVNIVTAAKKTQQVGEIITTHPEIRKVSFTGSTNIGRLLMKQASSTIKKVSWELGGMRHSLCSTTYTISTRLFLVLLLRSFVVLVRHVYAQTGSIYNQVYMMSLLSDSPHKLKSSNWELVFSLGSRTARLFTSVLWPRRTNTSKMQF